MNLEIKILFIATYILFVAGCKEKDETPVGDRLPGYIISFYFADSMGNNLLPYHLPDSPVRNPDNYRVYGSFDSESFIYSYTKHEEIGYYFKFGDSNLDRIQASALYQSDSVYKVYVCFGNNCDTIVAKPFTVSDRNHSKGFFNEECGAKWIVWGSDTIFKWGSDTTFKHPCTILPVKIK